jgi:hypothetical protein
VSVCHCFNRVLPVLPIFHSGPFYERDSKRKARMPESLRTVYTQAWVRVLPSLHEKNDSHSGTDHDASFACRSPSDLRQ